MHLSNQWIGPIQNVGVLIEVVYVLGFAWLMRTFGLRGLLLLAILVTALRLTLLATVPALPVVIATQALHGAAALLFQVIPPVLIDRYADSRFRHSMQGLFAMAITGLGRIIGSLAAGQIADRSLPLMYGVAAAVCLVAGAIVFLVFRDRPLPAEPGREPVTN
jgi:MFS family permease